MTGALWQPPALAASRHPRTPERSIGAVLVGVAVTLDRDSMELFIGESASPVVRQGLLAELRSFAEVDDVVGLLTMRIRAAQLLVAARLDLGQRLSLDQIEQLSTQIEERVHERFPQVEQIFLDPTAPAKRFAAYGSCPAHRAADRGPVRRACLTAAGRGTLSPEPDRTYRPLRAALRRGIIDQAIGMPPTEASSW